MRHPRLHLRDWGYPCRGLACAAVALLFLAAATRPAIAQEGVISGLVVDAETGTPLSGVQVELLSGTRLLNTVITEDNGEFRLGQVAEGRYSLVFSSLGYETLRRDGISVPVGRAAVAVGSVPLISKALLLNPIVVTASKTQEKALDAPASVYTVDAEQIQERPATTPADHVSTIPGVDIVTTGLAQHNVVARGFNNVFSGALFVLTDNRWASVPSLRFNAYNLIPVTNEDIERIELVLGPGSALYGPNVDKGVMHMITRSPLDHQGTTVSLAGGEREVFLGSLRHAGLISDNVGYKISGLYSRGRDWRFIDPVEEQSREAVIEDGADPDTLLIGARDFDQQRFLGDIRFDFRLDDESTLIFNGGATRLISSIEMTGIGAAQGDNWTYSYAQARFRRGNLFAQAYLNLSDAGDSFTLRDGEKVTDNSLLYVGQIQHGADIGERQRFIYGVDFIRTNPRTDGVINGRNEDDDNITEVGGYVQSETQLSPLVDLVLAGRLDYHSVIDDIVISPRAALVVKPTPEHSLRFTYNRAFSQPTTNNLFLDKLSSPDLAGLPFPVRGRGAPAEGFTFSRDCVAPATGQAGLCMRSPFTPAALGGPITPLPLDATLLWGAAVQVIAAQDAAAGQLLGLMQAPNGAQVASVMRSLNPTTLGFDLVESVADVQQTKSTITNTLEGGYKGLIADRLVIGLDVYWSRIEDFVGPLLVETPNVFLDPATLGPYLGAELTRLAGLGVIPPEQVPVLAAQLTEGMARVPLATVTPDQVDAAIQNGLDPATIILTYRNFPRFDLWGADFGATLLATDWLSFSGSYSFASENFFSAEELGAPTPLALNNPKNKASLAVHYHNERQGLRGEIRGRYVDSFPVISGVYVGDVDSYELFDVLISYKLPMSRSTEITLSATNVFDTKTRQMVGAPEIGRLLLARIRQSF